MFFGSERPLKDPGSCDPDEASLSLRDDHSSDSGVGVI